MSAKEKRTFRIQQAGLFFVFVLVAALAAAPVALSASASADTVDNQTTTAAYSAASASSADEQYTASAATAQMYGMQAAPKRVVLAEDAGTLAFQLVMAIAVAGLVLRFSFKQDDMPSDRS